MPAQRAVVTIGGTASRARASRLTHDFSLMRAPLFIVVSLAGLAVFAGLARAAPPAPAPEKFSFTTNWYAQAEHGGFYQALAKGLYRKEGLDVALKMGGPQVNIMQ